MYNEHKEMFGQEKSYKTVVNFPMPFDVKTGLQDDFAGSFSFYRSVRKIIRFLTIPSATPLRGTSFFGGSACADAVRKSVSQNI